MQTNNPSPHHQATNTSSNINYFAQQQQQQQTLQLIQNQHQQNLLNSMQLNTSSQSTQQSTQPPTQSPTQKDTTFTKIFVGGLPYHTTDQSLKQFFLKFGNIEEAVVITDRTTGKSRGYGFVTMETKEAAALAVYDPNPIIDGRKANVNLAYLGVKSRLAQPTGFIPVSIGRYPLQTAAFGFPQLYCQPNIQTAAQIHAYQPTTVTAPSPSSFLLQPSQTTSTTAAYISPPNGANPTSHSLLDFAAFEQQQQQQQQSSQAAYIQAANSFNLMNSGATSPQAVAAAAAAAANGSFFTIPPPHHLVNVNTFQSH